MIGGLKSKQHNINLINQILRLNIPQITTAVSNAICKYNIFDDDRPTNDDLLYIVFECLSSYLENLNLEHDGANVIIDTMNFRVIKMLLSQYFRNIV